MTTPITELRPIDLSLAETKPDLIAVSPVVSIETALNMMLKNRITSLPVFSHNDTEVVSIVNLFDILLYLLGGKKVIEKEKLRSQDPVELVLGLDTDRESYRVHKTDRKDKLIETLRAFASGIHRVLVVNFEAEQNKPWLLSQTDIIRHIVNHTDCVAGLLDLQKPVQDILPMDKRLITVKDTETALDVYRLMADKNVGGVPIINSNGDFVGDLCVEDLPSADLNTIDQLSLPCKEYLAKRPTSCDPPVTTPEANLKSIMDIMIKEDSHRVWVLEKNDSKKVIAVITMSDIIGLLCVNHKPTLF
ncbi:CBS-domain-containing protein [Backusella circina FSU 941]|nr:CBS-domain-containing protein [Backusella circina FSU 941]